MNLYLTWHEKFAKLSTVDPNIALKINQKGLWYISTQIRTVSSEGVLNAIASTAKTPEQVVNDFWNFMVTNLPSDSKLVLGLSNNGFKWEGSRWINVS